MRWEPIKKRLPYTLGPLLLAVLLWRTDLAAVGRALAGVAPGWLAVAALLHGPIFLARAWRWRLLLGPWRRQLGYGDTLGYYALSIFTGAFTPGQVGELAKAWLIRRKQIPLSQALFSAITDRLLGFVFVALCGFLFFTALLEPRQRLWPLVALAVAGLALWAGRRAVLALLRRLRARERWPRTAERIRAFLAAAPAVSAGGWIAAAGLTVSSWLLSWAAVYLAARGLGLTIPFWHLSGAMAMCALLAVLPISVMGVGTRDATLIFFLAAQDVSQPQALALSSLILALRLLYVGACSTALFTPAAKL